MICTCDRGETAHADGHADGANDFGNVGSDFAVEIASDSLNAAEAREGAEMFRLGNEQAWYEQARDQAFGECDYCADCARVYARAYVACYMNLIADRAVKGARDQEVSQLCEKCEAAPATVLTAGSHSSEADAALCSGCAFA